MKADKHIFPYTLRERNGNGTVYTGLTARDYIAIQAMVGFSANTGLNTHSYEEIADMAYEQADAMIKRSEIHDKKCSPQMIAEASCDGDIEKCKGACYK